MAAEKRDYYLHRGYNAEFRAAGADGENTGHIIEGFPAVYDQETNISDMFGEFREIIHKGAFDETDFTDVKFTVNHDLGMIPLARSRRNNKSDKPNTMELTVTEDGLKMTADIDTVNNEQARALYSAVSRGDMDGMSFIFFVGEDNDKWHKRDDGIIVREIFKIDKVIEVSAVNFPAYEGTNIDSRSLDSDKRALDKARAELESKANETKTIDVRSLAIMAQYKKEKTK